jgi:hypothetical protein
LLIVTKWTVKGGVFMQHPAAPSEASVAVEEVKRPRGRPPNSKAAPTADDAALKAEALPESPIVEEDMPNGDIS